ncbi:GIP, partial [Symbiodinium sp. CCMP2592]
MSPRGGPGGRKKGRKEGAVAGAGARSHSQGESGEGEDGGAAVVLELAELCPELRYAFQVFARYPTVGPRVFQKIYQVEKISRSSSSE